MNETIEKIQTTTIEQILPGLLERMKQGEDFVLEQAPLVIQELLHWKMATSLIVFIVFTLLYILAFLNWKAWFKYVSKEDGEVDAAGLWALVGGFFTAVLLVVSINSTWLDWLQIWLAPRVYLIEYTSELIK